MNGHAVGVFVDGALIVHCLVCVDSDVWYSWRVLDHDALLGARGL